MTKMNARSERGRWLARLSQARHDRERGDVPGWVMITLMTAAIVIAIMGVALPSLRDAVGDAISSVVSGTQSADGGGNGGGSGGGTGGN